MLNGALINVKVRYDDGSEEIIDEIKPKSVKKCDIHTAEEKKKPLCLPKRWRHVETASACAVPA